MVMRASSDTRAAQQPIRPGAARRGATIVEALLYLSVAAGVIAFSGQVVQGEQTRQRNQIVAADIKMVVDATQLYVAQNYDAIVADLFDDTSADTPMVAEFGLDRLVGAGFLPALFQSGTGGLGGIYGQDYTVLHRAVRRSAPTITLANTAALGADRVTLTDGGFEAGVNDELDLEVVLLSVPGPDWRVIEPQNGNRIVELTGRPATGFVQPEYVRGDGTPPVARGAFDGWGLSLEPFVDLRPEIFEGGLLASIISLPVTGVVSVLANARDIENLSRCADAPQNTAAYSECVAASTGNALYSDLVFNAWDSDGDGTLDRRPGISGLYQLEFGAPLDTDSDSIPDTFGTITNLFALSCHAADGGSGAPLSVGVAQEFEVNCPTTRLRGTVLAENATVTGDLAVSGRSTLADVDLTGAMFLDGGTTDLLDNVPVWSGRLDYVFGAEPNYTTKTRQENLSSHMTCPGSRTAVIEHALMGYEMSGPIMPLNGDDTAIDQIAVSEDVTGNLKVTLSGKWPLPVTVEVLAQVFCRTIPPIAAAG